MDDAIYTLEIPGWFSATSLHLSPKIFLENSGYTSRQID